MTKRKPQDLEPFRDLVSRIRIPHPCFERAAAEVARAHRSVGMTDFPQCLQIVGPSRAGKTCVLNDFRRSVPPVRTTEGLLLPTVYAKVPPKGTTMALLENILQGLGDPHWYRGSESNKLARVLNLLQQCECKVLLLDEFQHLCDKGQNKILRRTTDNLKALVEPNKWALVVSGLCESRRVVDADKQLAGRFDPELEIPRFEWTDASDCERFCGVLSAFHAAMAPFEFPDFEDDEIALRLYLATGGLMGFLVKLLHRAIQDAIDEGRVGIGLPQMETAFRRSVRFANRIAAGEGPFQSKFSVLTNPARMHELVELATATPDDEASGVPEANVTAISVKASPPAAAGRHGRTTKIDHKRELREALR